MLSRLCSTSTTVFSPFLNCSSTSSKLVFWLWHFVCAAMNLACPLTAFRWNCCMLLDRAFFLSSRSSCAVVFCKSAFCLLVLVRRWSQMGTLRLTDAFMFRLFFICLPTPFELAVLWLSEMPAFRPMVG